MNLPAVPVRSMEDATLNFEALQTVDTVARAYRATAFTVPTLPAKLPVDTVSFDPGRRFSLANGRYVCPVAGYYLVAAQFAMSVTSGSGVVAQIRKSGVLWSQSEALAGATANGSSPISDVVQCAAGDYLELWVFSGTSGALAVGSANSFLSVVQVG